MTKAAAEKENLGFDDSQILVIWVRSFAYVIDENVWCGGGGSDFGHSSSICPSVILKTYRTRIKRVKTLET